MKTYREALNFIASRHRFKKSPTLARMQLLMRKLGNPQKRIKMIHVTGTNGKGSVVTFVRNLLQQAGYTVGTFTSPYLVKFNERISVDGQPVSDNTILRLANQVKPVAEELDRQLSEGGPTEFELITAMMFLYFAEGHADVVVVEVGIGGLLDSTNVLIPEVSAITTVGWDHMRLLGNTLPKIAYQKAGIIKPNVPSVAGRIPQAPLNVIKRVARSKDSQLSILGRDFTVTRRRPTGWNEIFDFRTGDLVLKHARINLIGAYQVDNAAVAVETFDRFCRLNHVHPNPRLILRGLASTRWPGRFERLNDSPLVLIDGAHNVSAVQAIRPVLVHRFAHTSVYVILAIFADKQYRKMIRIFDQISNVHLVLTEFRGPGKRGAANLKPLARRTGAKNSVHYFDDWRLAIMKTVSMMSSNDVLLITGSLYFISQVRPLFVKHRS